MSPKRYSLRTIFLVAALMCAAFGLASCGGNENAAPPPDPVAEKQVSANAASTLPQAAATPASASAEAFKLGDRSFASLQDFVEEIEPRCATEQPTAQLRFAVDRKLRNARRTGPRDAGSVEIPVYFHVLTSSDGTQGDVSDQAIQDQIRVLNDAFAGQSPGGVGAATPFKFRLVETDRTANDEWFNMKFDDTPTDIEKAAKAALNKGDKGALNLYTARLADRTLGWARWPWELREKADGVVVRFSSLPGGSTLRFNEGDTATHEVGHWLGLFHTFEGGCDAKNDEVADTPAEESPASGCPVNPDTCPNADGQDPVDNFMDYSIDSCMFKFTVGQSRRMDDTHESYRQ